LLVFYSTLRPHLHHPCSKPVTLAATKPLFQLGALALSAFFAYSAATTSHCLTPGGALLFDLPARAGGLHGALLRLRAEGLRDVSLPLGNGNEFLFGLLQDG
jgi:hypothetical protein